MTDDSMAFAFAQFGEVARVHLARDADTKKLRGYASFMLCFPVLKFLASGTKASHFI